MSFRSFDLFNLVRDFGEDLTLRKFTSDDYSPATGSVEGSDTTDYTVLGYFYNYETLNVDQIRKGTRKCVISALSNVEPEESDLLIGNADTVSVVAVSTVFSNGAAICYICHVEE